MPAGSSLSIQTSMIGDDDQRLPPSDMMRTPRPIRGGPGAPGPPCSVSPRPRRSFVRAVQPHRAVSSCLQTRPQRISTPSLARSAKRERTTQRGGRSEPPMSQGCHAAQPVNGTSSRSPDPAKEFDRDGACPARARRPGRSAPPPHGASTEPMPMVVARRSRHVGTGSRSRRAASPWRRSTGGVRLATVARPFGCSPIGIASSTAPPARSSPARSATGPRGGRSPRCRPRSSSRRW